MNPQTEVWSFLSPGHNKINIKIFKIWISKSYGKNVIMSKSYGKNDIVSTIPGVFQVARLQTRLQTLTLKCARGSLGL